MFLSLPRDYNVSMLLNRLAFFMSYLMGLILILSLVYEFIFTSKWSPYVFANVVLLSEMVLIPLIEVKEVPFIEIVFFQGWLIVYLDLMISWSHVLSCSQNSLWVVSPFQWMILLMILYSLTYYIFWNGDTIHLNAITKISYKVNEFI